MEIRLSTRWVIRALLLILGVFFIGSVCVHAVGLRTGRWQLGGLTNLFNLDGDQTAPTWFNSLILLILCVIAWAIARVSSAGRMQHAKRWAFLGLVFLAMSIDEVATVHEAIGDVVGDLLDTKGYLYYGFVLPGVLLAGGLLVAYLPLLRSLPSRTALGMFAAGAVYVFGAAGIEAVSANSFYLRGDNTWEYRLLTNFEELFEMAGLILMIKVLLDHLRSLGPGTETNWRIRLGP